MSEFKVQAIIHKGGEPGNEATRILSIPDTMCVGGMYGGTTREDPKYPEMLVLTLCMYMYVDSVYIYL